MEALASQSNPEALPRRPATQAEVDELLLQEFLRRKKARKSADTFIDYVLQIAPWFIIDEVHIAIAEKFDKIISGEITRLMMFIAPRTGKSQLTSVFFPTYYLGKFPTEHIMQAGHSAPLSEGFGRESRNLLLDEDYQQIFPETKLAKDSRATAAWATDAGGKYNAVGVMSGIAGKGFNIGIVDDPLNEQTANSPSEKEKVWNWYGPGFYSRRDPMKNAIIIINTRWAVDDLTGRILAHSVVDPEADIWEVLSIPALLDEQSAELLTRISNDPKYRKYLSGDPITFQAGDSFSPRRFSKKFLMSSKANMTKRMWAALYQQKPYEDEGGILPRNQWRKWTKEEPPECSYVLQVYDTAFEEDERSDCSARTTWGVFRRPEDGKYSVILLERLNKQLSFPELRDNAYDSYLDYQPNRVLIEKKASGHSLLQELRRKGVPIRPLNPGKDSKLARAHAASIVLEQGCVYYMPRLWAEEVIQQCAEFPNGKLKDLVDTCTYAWIFLRRTYHLNLGDEADEDDEDDWPLERKRHWYLNRGGFGKSTLISLSDTRRKQNG